MMSVAPNERANNAQSNLASKVTANSFGLMPDGELAQKYNLKNNNGVEVCLTNFGATILSIITPDKFGNYADIALGHDALNDYIKGDAHMGAVAGRYAGRIAKGNFQLNGKTYQLFCNAGKHHLHGGKVGFNKKLWRALPFTDEACVGVKFSLLSVDGDEGYPGNMETSVSYCLDDDNALSISYEATADKDTIINLTQHCYFNLSGTLTSPINDHLIQINADKYLSVDGELIPTGKMQPVANTPLDFKSAKPIGDNFDYDHTYVLAEAHLDKPKLVAMVKELSSGRTLSVSTDQPALQFYTANSLSSEPLGKNGQVYGPRCGFCLETQNFPDAINHANFPSPALRAGEVFKSKTIYQFGISQ